MKENDVDEYVRGLRERFYGPLEEVLSAAIDYAKNGKDGGWLAYEMLKDGGVIPPRTMKQKDTVALPSAMPETEDTAVKRMAVALVEGAIERQRFFGLPLPEVEEFDAGDFKGRSVCGA